MELYEVKRPGFIGPLNSREISHLFRVGYLDHRVRCKPAGTAQWRTIGELFPLLDYGAGGYSLPSDGSKSGRRLSLTFALVATLLASGAFLQSNRPARDLTKMTARARPSSHEVATATAASVFLLYSRSAQDSAEVRPAAKLRGSEAGAAFVFARNN